MRVHRKVWLWWGSGWAVQFVATPAGGVGVHLDFRRPGIDLHLGPFTFAVGRNAVRTPPDEAFLLRCRGMLVEGQ